MIKKPKLENIETEFYKHDGVEYNTQEQNGICPLVFYMHMPIRKTDIGVYGITKFLDLEYKINVYIYSFYGGSYDIYIQDRRAKNQCEVLCKKSVVLNKGEWYNACIGVCKTWDIKFNGDILVMLISTQKSQESHIVKMHVKFYKDR